MCCVETKRGCMVTWCVHVRRAQDNLLVWPWNLVLNVLTCAWLPCRQLMRYADFPACTFACCGFLHARHDRLYAAYGNVM
jgi:hypothetical protein